MTALRRAAWAAAALAVCAACRPELDDDVARVDGPRVLAVRIEPPEAKPGDAVTIRAIYTDGALTADAPLAYAFCAARRGLAEPSAIAESCLAGDTGARLTLGTGAEARGVIPADACRLFGPERPVGKPGEPAGRPVDPDGTGGYYQPGIVSAPAADETFFDVRVRCGLAGATQAAVADFEARYRANTNPEIAEVAIVRGGAFEHVAEGAELTAEAGETLRLRVTWPDCTGDAACGGAERYVAYDPGSRVVNDRREAMRVSWLATAGRFEHPRTGRAEDELAHDSENGWRAPSDAGQTAMWIVLRDARGGTAFRALRVRVIAR